MNYRNVLGIILWLIIVSGTGICVNITKVEIPDIFVINNESQNVIVLDCKYEILRGETNLVVKWQKDGAIIYQWIHGFAPKAFPHMKDQIDETYEASADSLQKYRALALINPSWNTTGNYKCLVQTKQSAASQTKFLQIIDVSNYTLNIQKKTFQDYLEVKCIVENVYPQPKLKIRSNVEKNIHLEKEEYSRNENGYFNVAVISKLKNTDNDDSELSCLMSIPNSNFTVGQSVISSELGNGSAIQTSNCSALIIALLVVFYTQFSRSTFSAEC